MSSAVPPHDRAGREEAPPTPSVAREVFGDRTELAERYVQLLADGGVQRGLLGPREVQRLWPRHVLNCAPLTQLLPSGARVVDLGSGAGLPGLVIAIARPDLRVDLVEPMARRTTFLDETVRVLGVGDSVRVIRGRAEEKSVRAAVGDVDWVVARAVAPLPRLVEWARPLLSARGQLLAMKGATAAAEVAEFAAGDRSAALTELLELRSSSCSDVIRVVRVALGRSAKKGGARV